MTTLVGKILVLLNVALALLMAAFALGVYTRNIEWSADTKKSAQETVARVKALQEELSPSSTKPGTGLWAQLAAAEQYWKDPTQEGQGTHPDAYTRVELFEQIRPRNQKWYADQLTELVETPNQIKKPSYKDGRLEVLKFNLQVYGQPKMVEATDGAGRALRGFKSYKQEYDQRQQEIVAAMKELNKWIDRDAELTEKIGGEHGLRFQIAREIDKTQRVVAEQDYLKPLLVNTAVESDLLVQRREQLEARVKELQGVGVASSR
jgi:hypothetical protein